MADDTVQQIVQSVPSSPINAHPALIERRSRRRRKFSKEKQEGREKDTPNGQEQGRDAPAQLTDTVTLSSGADTHSGKKELYRLPSISLESADTNVQYPARVAVKILSKVRTNTIDIRI